MGILWSIESRKSRDHSQQSLHQRKDATVPINSHGAIHGAGFYMTPKHTIRTNSDQSKPSTMWTNKMCSKATEYQHQPRWRCTSKWTFVFELRQPKQTHRSLCQLSVNLLQAIQRTPIKGHRSKTEAYKRECRVSNSLFGGVGQHLRESPGARGTGASRPRADSLLFTHPGRGNEHWTTLPELSLRLPTRLRVVSTFLWDEMNVLYCKYLLFFFFSRLHIVALSHGITCSCF